MPVLFDCPSLRLRRCGRTGPGAPIQTLKFATC
jgi:hypothetical protein